MKYKTYLLLSLMVFSLPSYAEKKDAENASYSLEDAWKKRIEEGEICRKKHPNHSNYLLFSEEYEKCINEADKDWNRVVLKQREIQEEKKFEEYKKQQNLYAQVNQLVEDMKLIKEKMKIEEPCPLKNIKGESR